RLQPASDATDLSSTKASEAPAKITTPPEQTAGSSSKVLVLVSVAAIVLVAVTFFITRRHYAPAEGNPQSATPSTSSQNIPASEVSAPAQVAPRNAETTQVSPEPALPAPLPSPSTAKDAPPAQPNADSGRSVGTLIVVAGQDNAIVFVDGKPQPGLTRSGQ